MICAYTYHRFGSEQAFMDLLAALGWAEAPPPDVSFDVIGTIYRQDTPPEIDPQTGEIAGGPAAVAGWHVNAAWRDTIPAAFVASLVQPVTPFRVWA